MLTGVENCARTPPMLLPVEPLPCALSRSMTRTLFDPAAVKCQAILEPTIPPPAMTTSAVLRLIATWKETQGPPGYAKTTLCYHFCSTRNMKQLESLTIRKRAGFLLSIVVV